MYTWDFDTPSVRAAYDALTAAEKAAFHALMDALMFDPAEYGRQPDEPVGPTKIHRTISFDAGRGLVSFFHWERDREVIVTRIQHP